MTHKLTYNDHYHSYYLDGVRCKSATTVVSLCQDSYTLDQWRKRQVAIGFTLEPKLRERVAVDLTNKQAINAICEDAMRVAGASEAAHRGTQRHRASEIFDTGGKLITEQQRTDALTWQRTLNLYGLEPLPEYTEGFVIHPDYGVVGRFDRVCRYESRLVMVDLKSGANAVKYPHKTVAQLGLYAYAPLTSKTISTAGDKSTITEWAPFPPELDLEKGYVILIGDGMDVGELWEIDIAYGWEGAQQALDMIKWRKRESEELVRRVPVDLFKLIKSASSEAVLRDIWRVHKEGWTSEHNKAAGLRKRELEMFGRLGGQAA